MYGLVTLALAAAASAIPLVARETAATTVPPPPAFFLGMSIRAMYFSLTVGNTQNSGDFMLIAQNLADYPGVTASLVGNGSYALRFNLGGEGYSAIVPDAGEVDGYSARVGVDVTGVDNGFYYSNGTIGHSLTAGDQFFMACDINFGGVETYALNWGRLNENGSLPYGCVGATLHANCNVGNKKPFGCPAVPSYGK